MNRVLLGCFEAPGFGGASTVAHDIARHLQNRGHHVPVVTMIEGDDVHYYQLTFGECFGNPYGLADAVTCVVNDPLNGAQPELQAAIERLAPDVMVGIGDVASSLLARLQRKCRLVFVTTGCQQAKLWIAG